jgi:hypothetical protein
MKWTKEHLAQQEGFGNRVVGGHITESRTAVRGGLLFTCTGRYVIICLSGCLTVCMSICMYVYSCRGAHYGVEDGCTWRVAVYMHGQVCICVYVQACVYACASVYIRTYIHQQHSKSYIYIHACIHKIQSHTHIHTYMHIFTEAEVCMDAKTSTHAYTYILTYIHARFTEAEVCMDAQTSTARRFRTRFRSLAVSAVFFATERSGPRIWDQQTHSYMVLLVCILCLRERDLCVYVCV